MSAFPSMSADKSKQRRVAILPFLNLLARSVKLWQSLDLNAFFQTLYESLTILPRFLGSFIGNYVLVETKYSQSWPFNFVRPGNLEAAMAECVGGGGSFAKYFNWRLQFDTDLSVSPPPPAPLPGKRREKFCIFSPFSWKIGNIFTNLYGVVKTGGPRYLRFCNSQFRLFADQKTGENRD